MDENQYRSHGLPREPQPHHESRDEAQSWYRVESQIRRSISPNAPLAEVLNHICWALDLHIGGIVSMVLMPGDDPASLQDIESDSSVFGLELFYSIDITGASGEDLGHIEMYCCTARSPSASEYRLIVRAMRLAAMAIEGDGKIPRRAGALGTATHPLRGNVPTTPLFPN